MIDDRLPEVKKALVPHITPEDLEPCKKMIENEWHLESQPNPTRYQRWLRDHPFVSRNVSSSDESTEQVFNRLLSEWKASRGTTSSLSTLLTNEAYVSIIGLGPSALPLLLRELQLRPDLYFWALRSISREDPVPPEHIGKTRLMVRDWLSWGRDKGLI